MRAQLILNPSDLLKIARLVHDTPHDKNDEYVVSYYSDGLRLDIYVVEDSDYGYCVQNVAAKAIAMGRNDGEDYFADIEVPYSIQNEIENVL